MNSELSLVRARRLLGEGKLADSLAAFQAAALEGAGAEAQYGVGFVRLKTGDVDAAASAFRACLRTDPGHANAAYQLGAIAERERQPDIARAYYERALRSNPAHAAALRKLGARSAPAQRPAASAPAAGASAFFRLLLDDPSPLARQVVGQIRALDMSVRPRLRAFLNRVLWLAVVPFVAGAVADIAYPPAHNGDPVFVTTAILMLLPLAWLVLSVKTRTITFAEGRIVITSGVLLRDRESIELYRVADVRLRQSLVNRITGDGRLILEVEHGGKPGGKIVLRGLATYSRLQTIADQLRSLVLLLRTGSWGKGFYY